MLKNQPQAFLELPWRVGAAFAALVGNRAARWLQQASKAAQEAALPDARVALDRDKTASAHGEVEFF